MTAVLVAPALAPGLELLGALQGSGYRSAPGLVRRADGQTVQVTTVLYALLELVDGSRDVDELARRLGDRLARDVHPDDVRFLLGERAASLGLLDDGRTVAAAKADPLLALSHTVVVSDPVWTWRLTTPFAHLFRPVVVVPVLAAFAWTTWWLLAEQGLAAATRQAVYEPGLLLAVVALTVASAGFHEFGHAAACRYGGARPGAMGFGLYLVWPAFFTDVDDSYRLSRWGRLRVDLGGLYFNALVSVGLAAAWALTRQDWLLLGIASQLLQMVRQLAPFLRADGYHLLADLTGVPDLFAHLGPTLKALVPGRPRVATPLKPWARVVVTAWVLLVVPVLLGLLVMAVLLLPRLVATAWDSAGLRLDALAAWGGDPVVAAAELLSLVALVLPVVGITCMLLRVVRRTARRTWLLTDGRPRLRALALLAGLLLGAAVLASWVPDEQRTPLSSTERGTVAEVLAPVVQPVAAAAPVAEPAVRPVAAAAPRTAPAPRVVALPATAPAPSLTAAQPAVAFGPPTRNVLRLKVPLPPGPDGNQALAVGTRDGRLVYDAAYALVEVVDGSDVRHRNEAWALATCRDCTTVAVAVQVVLIVGGSQVVVPVNAAVAANDQCVRCATTAVAVQVVLTLRELPAQADRKEIQQALKTLDELPKTVPGLAPADVLAQVKAVEATVLAILARTGLVDTGRPAPGTAPATPVGAPTEPPAPYGPAVPAEPAPDPTPEPTTEPEPTSEPTPEPTPEPQPSSAPDTPTARLEEPATG